MSETRLKHVTRLDSEVPLRSQLDSMRNPERLCQLGLILASHYFFRSILLPVYALLGESIWYQLYTAFPGVVKKPEG